MGRIDTRRFSLLRKDPKQITHVSRLIDVDSETQQFIAEASALEGKLGPILVQLPPSLEFDVAIVEPFFSVLRQLTETAIVCEPRHLSWFALEPESLMTDTALAGSRLTLALCLERRPREAASRPSIFAGMARPACTIPLTTNWTLSDFAKSALAIASEANDVWCIFDNTALGEAWRNAITLNDMLKPAAPMDAGRCR